VVSALNARPVRSAAELRARLGVLPVGETVELREVQARGSRGTERAVGVASVQPDTPAFKHGLRAGDIIFGVNGRRITSLAALSKALRGPGSVALNVLRGDSLLSLPVR
jgi:serine protease Do/serine protease DegQ